MSNDGTDLRPAGDYAIGSEAATAKLAELTAQYNGVAPEAPQNATEARARLQALAHDQKWYDAYMRGSQPHRAEFDRLTLLVAADDGAYVGQIETVDAVSDPSALSRGARAALFDGLREQGLPPSAELYMNQIDSGEQSARPTEGDGAACKQMIDRLLNDASFRDKYLAGDIAAVNNLNSLSRVVAYAAQDGQPMTEAVAKQIASIRPR
jgi:hypothetical protein